MVKRHLIRLAAPKSWPIKRKGITFITKPTPGPQSLERCMPLKLIIKSILKYAKTSKEAKAILSEGKILINGKVRKDPKFPVGLFDIVEIPLTKEIFIFLYNKKGKLTLSKIKERINISKIIKKTILKGKKIQLNLHDGQNVIVEKDDYKVGDTVILENKKIKKHLKLEKGALVYLISGKHIGATGNLQEIKKSEFPEPPKVIIKINDKNIEASKDCLFVIEKSLLKENE